MPTFTKKGAGRFYGINFAVYTLTGVDTGSIAAGAAATVDITLTGLDATDHKPVLAPDYVPTAPHVIFKGATIPSDNTLRLHFANVHATDAKQEAAAQFVVAVPMDV